MSIVLIKFSDGDESATEDGSEGEGERTAGVVEREEEEEVKAL